MTMIFKNNLRFANRRAISPVIGSMFMLAIVAAFGSILMFQGIEGVNSFTNALNIFDESESKSVQEKLLIEHVQFDSDTDDVFIWVRNIGQVEVVIDRITLVKIDTQDLIIQNTTSTENIFPKELQMFSITGDSISLPGSCTQWDCSVGGNPLKNSAYQVSVTTSRGNSFKTTAQPFYT